MEDRGERRRPLARCRRAVSPSGDLSEAVARCRASHVGRPRIAPLTNPSTYQRDQGARGYSMAEGQTKLTKSDYRFLQRFLDVTKANLFFARGVVIVEGDAENILLPVIARLIGRDFEEYGVSVVDVGVVGLSRSGRIFR